MLHQTIALFWGIAIGFAAAVPVGPVGIICVQRTLTKSRMIGLITGLGAALADGFLAAVGAFGIKIISDFIIQEAGLLRVIGGFILLLLGLSALLGKKKKHMSKPDTALTMIEHFLSGIVLTITNPLTAFTFFVAFAGVGPRLGIGGEFVATSLVVGVVIGSCLWWLFLTYMASIFEHKIKDEYLDLINKWFGAVIAVLGIIVLMGSIFN